MAKFLGIDLGTNSIGLTVRNTTSGKEIIEQLDYFSSIVFKKGVGVGKSGEYSYAAERTKNRSARRLYQARKYRIWETLKVLVEYGYCPLSIEGLDKWRKYDKTKGLKRQYPINELLFEQWVRLDFNGDGISDYSSPYQLRDELATQQLDFSIKENCYRLGRALYHIAQRRGFKSSKGETLKESEKNNEEIDFSIDYEVSPLQKSELKISKTLSEYLIANKLPTIGCAFAKLEREGFRIRNSEYQTVRSQYKNEIKYIFNFQEGLNLESDLFLNKILSEKKNEGTIFFKRPLRSQKGLVGKCTLETNKPRCPIGHFELEEFRAWSFINNILFRRMNTDDWKNLSIGEKQSLFNDKFMRTKPNFLFSEIREWIEKRVGYKLSNFNKTINYKDNTNIAGCPVSGRLKNIFGENWKQLNIKSLSNNSTYKIEDIWHVCFSFDDEEYITDFAKYNLGFDEKQTKSLIYIWNAIPQGYSMLSLKAIKNINLFLKQGYIYSEAVLLAKLPNILGDDIWANNKEFITNSISTVINENKLQKQVLNITNSLIANYKNIESEKQFASKNSSYILDESDKLNIQTLSIENFGAKKWELMQKTEKNYIITEIEKYYQKFFNSSKREYYKLPKVGNSVKLFLSDNFDFLHCENNFVDNHELPCKCNACKKLNKLYHPSLIEFYKPAKEHVIDVDGKMLLLKQLDSPKIGAFKNPMAMRTLHILRKSINKLLIEGIIDEDTRIVVETARDLNDANMRWAIETYQKEREKENKEIEKILREFYNNDSRNILDSEIDKARLLTEQSDITEKGNKLFEPEEKSKKNLKYEIYKKDVTKYRLWLEQGCCCIYTGKSININTLFDENKVDFEHTIPRSISFDNSLANLTVCDAYYNRNIKKNQIPAQLQDHEVILLRIQPWVEKVERLKDNVEFWKGKSKQAQTKDNKDNAIRQKLLWQMELDYWNNKVSRFTMTEITSKFKHSQLVDTRIISKYAFHYLKSLFHSVDVQKGSITSDFRKMLGVQSIFEKKNRDKHSHHAIDAAILTMIPSAVKRDKMLELYYKIDENKKQNPNIVQQLKEQLEIEKKNCNIKGISELVDYIEENIAINHISKDQTLTPAKKKARKRGKEIFVKDKNGNLVNKWITGDCIRGQLHEESFLGAIKKVKLDENGNLIKENGKFIFEDKVAFVIRKELKYKKNENDSGFKNLEDIEKCIVDKHIFKAIKIQSEQNGGLKDAIEKGIWMLGKDGKPTKIDKNGNYIGPIRHIRVYVNATEPLEVKKQTYVSKKRCVNIDNREHKQWYYANNASTPYYAFYQGVIKNKIERDYQIINLFDASKLTTNNKLEVPKYTYHKKSIIELPLYHILKIGTRVLFFKENPEELGELDSNQLNKRLYIVTGFEKDGRIQFKYHLEARDDKTLIKLFGKNGGKSSNINFDNPCPKLRISKNNFNMLIEEKDFKITLLGEIIINK